MILRQLMNRPERGRMAAALFGVRFLWVESYVFDSASSLCPDFDGGPWNYYILSNGGFYMAPRTRISYHVESATGLEADMSADAFGLAASLCAFALLSHPGEQHFAASCAENYGRVHAYVSQHAEERAITTFVGRS